MQAVIKILLSIFIFCTLEFCITLIYWYIWGRKIKNKKAVFDFLNIRSQVVLYTIIFCSAIHAFISFYFMPENIWENTTITVELKTAIASLPVKIIQVAPLICLSFLVIPVTLIRCLKSSIRKENKQNE